VKPGAPSGWFSNRLKESIEECWLVEFHLAFVSLFRNLKTPKARHLLKAFMQQCKSNARDQAGNKGT
jgi:hypothetical protein